MQTPRKRTRPGAASQRPDRTNAPLPPLNQPYAGCCKPYPDLTFKNGALVSYKSHHNGPLCKGYLETHDVTDWVPNDSPSGGHSGDER